jgi:hypothetical protein
MKKSKLFKTLVFLLIAFHPILSNPISYNEIDSILESTWKETYPLPYTKIIKKDTLGKGIMVLKDKKGLYYLYSFLLFFPRSYEEDGVLKTDDTNGKEILVRLYYRPANKEMPYSLDLGEFTEKYNLKSVLRWIQ